MDSNTSEYSQHGHVVSLVCFIVIDICNSVDTDQLLLTFLCKIEIKHVFLQMNKTLKEHNIDTIFL